MTTRHSIDNEARLLITKVEGEAIDSDLAEALKQYQSDIQLMPEYAGYNEIVDLTDVTRIKLTAKGLVNIGKIASGTDESRPQTKVAFVVSSDLALNFVRLYATYRNFGKNTRKKIGVFKSESEAISWAQNIELDK